jgi:hypothetical protein
MIIIGYFLIGFLLWIFLEIDIEVSGFKIDKRSMLLICLLLWPFVLIKSLID